MSEPSIRSLIRPMQARDPDEEHRAATPLELFFDLCFVVAVSLAAGHLHHAIADGQIGHAVVAYLGAFFAIWWAWMNFTWFATTYDNDDTLYRLTTLVQIAGALVLAAGVPRAFDNGDFRVVTFGYVLMRLAMVTQWLRAARSDELRRSCALRYAAGITVVQVGWVARLALPPTAGWIAFGVLIIAELAVPVWADPQLRLTFHTGHLGERYSLFTLIVLGESVLAATTALSSAVDEGHDVGSMLSLAGAGLVIVFSMWWLYFGGPVPEERLTSRLRMFTWGYGHFVVFSAAAAVGAGLEVAIDYDSHHAHIGPLPAGYAIALPVALYVLFVWLLQIRACPEVYGMLMTVAFPVIAGLILLTPFGPAPVHVTAGLLAVLAAIMVATRRSTAGQPAGGE